jgi:hypothetical protein
MNQRTIVGGVIVVIIVVVIALFATRDNAGSPPASETAFINGMAPIMAQTNDPTKFATLEPQRAAMICQNITNNQVTGWVGTLQSLDTSNPQGDMLAIAVMPNVMFGTAPNPALNTASNTLIPSGSPLATTLAKLQPGAKVEFSGTLFPSKADCIQESSSTMGDTMQHPDFLIKFTDLKALPNS